MPITIWEPARYAEGFAIDDSEFPINGVRLSGVLGTDHKIREIARFAGSTTDYFADTGEMEFTFSGYDVEPSDIKRGRLIEVEGRHYIIEQFSWEVTEEGHICTISGRDLGAYLDNIIDISNTKIGPYKYYSLDGETMEPRTSIGYIAHDFFGGPLTAPDGYNVDEWNDMGKMWRNYCGWFRDEDRLPVRYVEDFEKTVAALQPMLVQNINTTGANIRILANVFNIGYRFQLTWNENKKMYEICLVAYNKADLDVRFHSTDRGVSGWKYQEDGRTEVNAALTLASTTWNGWRVATGDWVEEQNTENPVAISSFDYKTAGLKNNAEVAEFMSMGTEDFGAVSEEFDGSWTQPRAWLAKQSTSIYQEPEKQVSFEYDNSGPLKFGQHFELGSSIVLADEYTGISSRQKLIAVKTTYAAGAAKSYGFTFGSQTIKQSDIIKKKFGKVDRRLFTARNYNWAN